MRLKHLLSAAGALALSAPSAMAQAVDRAAAPISDASQMGGSSSLLLIIAVVLFGAGIFFLVNNDDDDPDSP